MLVREAILNDARRIAEIHVAAWRWSYCGIMPDATLDGLDVNQREANWTKLLEEKRERALVAEENVRVMGWITFGPCNDADAQLAAGVRHLSRPGYHTPRYRSGVVVGCRRGVGRP